jgi:hypothetical protein
MVENEFVILDPTNITDNDKINKQCNTISLNIIYNGIDSKVFEQIKDIEKASEVWVRLEETYEGTSTVKSAKLYMLKDKLSNFKIRMMSPFRRCSISYKSSSMILRVLVRR